MTPAMMAIRYMNTGLPASPKKPKPIGWLKRQMKIALVMCVWSLGVSMVLLAIDGWHIENSFVILMFGVAMMTLSFGMANRMWSSLS